MRQTVVATFDRYAAAKQAANELRDSGFGDSVYLTDEVGSAPTKSSASTEQDTGVFSHVRQFFSGLFGDDDKEEASPYAEALRRGGAVVKVEVDDDDEVERARVALEAAGAVDIDERASEWRASGWNEGSSLTREEPSLGSGGQTSRTGSSLADQSMSQSAGSESIGGFPAGQSASSRTASGSADGLVTGAERSTGATDDERDVIPVVKEELRVGKRAVRKGGVRVYARTVETPVQESVQLRSEHAQVERRTVDRPATEADVQDIGERTIEVRETAEEPVVAKQARVVEEVSVGKTLEQRTENIADKVRSTEVEVESLPGESAAGSRPDYRTHFDSNFSSSGGRWDDYEPAYHYGEAARSDARYQGRQWDEVEPQLRGGWESLEPGTWEKFKAAIRHAWERVKS
jgi:uncharacterized protein (TIGR02271 family)